MVRPASGDRGERGAITGVLDGTARLSSLPALTMANTPKWNVRLRHEWLSTPLKKKRVKRSEKARIGLLEAEARKAAKEQRKQESSEQQSS